MEVGTISLNPFYGEWMIDEATIRRCFKSNERVDLKSPQFNCFKAKSWTFELIFDNKKTGDTPVYLTIKDESYSYLPDTFDFTGSYAYFMNYKDSTEWRISIVKGGNYWWSNQIFQTSFQKMKELLSLKGIITLRFFINATKKDEKPSSTFVTRYPELTSENLYNKSDFSDVQLCVGSVKFYAHKAILANCSPVFAAMFRNEMMEKNNNLVEISDFTAEVVENLLSYIYLGKFKINESVMYDLSNAAEKYQIADLKTLCANYIYNFLTVENCLEMVSFADKYNMCQLKQKIIFFIGNNYNLDFTNSEAFIELERSNLKLFAEIAKYCMQAKV